MKRYKIGRGMAVVMIAGLGLLAPAIGHAQVVGTTFQKLFTQTDPPDASGGDMEIWALNDAAHFAFVTERTDGVEGVYYWDGKTAKFLEPSASAWTPGGTNNAELVAAALETGSDNHDETHVWDMKTGKLTVLVKPDMPVPGGGTVESNSNRESTRINQNGQVVSDLTVDGAYAVVRIEPADGKFTLVAKKGTDLGGGKTADNAASPDINDSGVVVFQDHPYDTTADTGIYMWDNGTITAIATSGMDAPGGGKITNAEYPVINNAGDVAFRGTVDSDEALFLWRKSTGKLTLIAKKGTDLGGGALFTQVEGNRRHAVEINNSGLVVASVWIGDGDDGGVIFYNINTGKTTVLAKTGQDLGGGIGAVQAIANGRGGIASFDVAINNNTNGNQILFVAKVGDKESMILATLPKTVP